MKVIEKKINRSKFSFFHFFIPPRNNLCFVCRAKGKLLLRGPQRFYESTQRIWRSKVIRFTEPHLIYDVFKPVFVSSSYM